MTSDQVRVVVDNQFAQWKPPAVAAAFSIGVAWDEKRYRAEIDILRAALVTPRLQEFRMAETYDQVSAVSKPIARYWIVAAIDQTVLWYDESAGEFGLGEMEPAPQLPTSIGVRGDMIGSFCAR